MKIYRNEIVRRIAVVVLSFVVITAFAPSFAWQNAYADDATVAGETVDETTVQDKETSPEEPAEDAGETVEFSLDDLEPVGSEEELLTNAVAGIYTEQPSDAVAAVGDRYRASCKTNFDVTGHISVQQKVYNRVAKSWLWVDKVGSDHDYKAGETIVVGQLHATDEYGNKSDEPSTQTYRFAITVGDTKVCSDKFTISWKYPIIKTQVSEIDYPIIGKAVDKDVVITSTYLNSKNEEKTSTTAAKASSVTWYEFTGSTGSAFNGTYSAGHTYSVSVKVKPESDYFFPEGDAFKVSNSKYKRYEHNGKDCDATILGMSVQLASISSGNLTIDSSTSSPLAGKNAYRVAGADRYDTALKVADAQKTSAQKFKSVVLAYGLNYPDALAGSFLAISNDAPILLIENSKAVRNKVINYINKNVASGGKIYILGGTSAIPSSIQTTLKNNGFSVTRLGGASRYETNIKILEAASMAGKPVVVCSGEGYADSLSASSTGYPILIVDPKAGISDKQIAFLRSRSASEFYVIGGTKALPATVDASLKRLGSVTRLAGDSRYETSKMVAEQFSPEGRVDNVVVAYGENFPDGLCAGPLAATKNASLILAQKNATAMAKEYVDNHVIINGYITGGTLVLPDATAKKIMNADSVITLK